MEGDKVDQMLRHNEALERMVYVEGNHLIINVEYEYSIELSRLRTHEQILSWVFHLTEKTWMTNDVMRHFIMAAVRASKLTLPDA